MALLLSFRLGTERFLIPLEVVERVLPAAALSSLPAAPPELPGLLTVREEPVPVIDLRGRLGLPTRLELEPGDHFLLIHAQGKRVALWVDEALEVLQIETWQPTTDLVPPGLVHLLPWVQGVALPDGRSQVVLKVDALLDLAGAAWSSVEPIPADGGQAAQ